MTSGERAYRKAAANIAGSFRRCFRQSVEDARFARLLRAAAVVTTRPSGLDCSPARFSAYRAGAAQGKTAMDSEIPLGKKQIIDGRLRVYYYGYWIRAYDAPADSLLAKKQLIQA